MRRDCLIRVLIAALVVYIFWCFREYSTYPLALAPQLDAKEILNLADQIDLGSLETEPFYRAMIYPALLSLIEPATARPGVGLCIGTILHLLNIFLIYRLSWYFWQTKNAALISSTLFAIHPPTLFFAFQLFDITLGLSLFLGGFLLLLQRSQLPLLLGGSILGICVLTRPHFLPVAVLLPFAALYIKGFRKETLAPHLLSFVALVLVLLAQGGLNYARSGDFRVLPWQGPYSLWAANKPGSTGLYFTQAVPLPNRQAVENPARIESEILYAKETGNTRPFSIEAMNAFWSRKTIDFIWENPFMWIRHLMWKGYAVLNNVEQYNNLSFSFHQKNILSLRLNPMHWGLFLLLSIPGFVLLFDRNKRFFFALIGLTLATSIGLFLYYASARFRIPLTSFLAIGSGGLMLLPSYLKNPRKHSTLYLIGTLCIFVGILTYSKWGGISNRSTEIQDKLLLANAYADLGNDIPAANYALEVLKTEPLRPEALRVYTLSYFNWAVSHPEGTHPLGPWSEQKYWLKQTIPTDSVQDFVLGMFYWKWDSPDQARALWTQIAKSKTKGAKLSKIALELTNPQQSEVTNIPAEGLASSLHTLLFSKKND